MNGGNQWQLPINFSAILPWFRAEDRKQSVAGHRDRKVSVLFSLRQSDFRNFNKLQLHLGNLLELFVGDLISLHLYLHSYMFLN